MDMLKNLNAAVRYIDENLCGEIDIERAALTAGAFRSYDNNM